MKKVVTRAQIEEAAKGIRNRWIIDEVLASKPLTPKLAKMLMKVVLKIKKAEASYDARIFGVTPGLPDAGPQRKRPAVNKEPMGRSEAFSHLPWWRKDRWGFPIEYIKNRPIHNFIRTVCLNIKKLKYWRKVKAELRKGAR